MPFPAFSQTDSLLRGGLGPAGEPLSVRASGKLVACVVVFGALYGAVMGMFGGLSADRYWQITFSAIKVPLLLTATFSISLPSFFMLNTLLGVRQDFADVLRGLLATQAGLTIILASLAPFTAFWYVSTVGYQTAILFNALMFATASITGQALLVRYYRPLIARRPVHRVLMRVWLCLYAFVGIQMAWVLRPFVGAPNVPTQFFRDEKWGNAYVEVLRLIWESVTK